MTKKETLPSKNKFVVAIVVLFVVICAISIIYFRITGNAIALGENLGPGVII
jgi:hypothetical protein